MEIKTEHIREKLYLYQKINNMQNEINLQDFKNILNYLIDNNKRLVDEGKYPLTIGCEGLPGCGKTSVIEQIAKERGMTYVKVSLSQIEEIGDISGYPLKEFKVNELDEDGNVISSKWVAQDILSTYFQKPCETYEITTEHRMSYAPPAWLPREENPNGILVTLDDWNRTNSVIMNCVMEIICTGKYMTWELPKYTTLVLSANPDSGEFLVQSQDSAILTRYINFPVKFDIDIWSRYAEQVEMDSRVINFALSYSSELFTSKDGVNVVNARSYTMFGNAISGLNDWSTTENLSLILNIAKGCFPFDKDNVIGGLFTSFIASKLDKLISPKDLLLKGWETVKKEIKDCVYDGDKYRPEIANILATRLLNYILLYFDTKGNKTSVVQDRLLDIINSKEKLFSEDLIFNIVKTLATKHAAKMNKILMIPSIRQKLL